MLVANIPRGKRGDRPKPSSGSGSSSSGDRGCCAGERPRPPAAWTASPGGGWARSLGPNAFREASVRPRSGAPPFKCPPSAQREAVDPNAPPPLTGGPGPPQLFSICSMSNSPSREQGLFPGAPRSRQAMAGSPFLLQTSSGAGPSESSQHSSSLQARGSSKDAGRGSGTGVPAGVRPPGPEAEADSSAVQDLVLLTWRVKGLWGPQSSIPALRQLRLLKV